MLRRSLLSLTILASLAAPAMADGLKVGGIPLTNNTMSNTNIAAGQNNIAAQKVFQTQSGGGYGYGYKGYSSGVTSNSATNSNVAAGQGNIAAQEIFQLQSGR